MLGFDYLNIRNHTNKMLKSNGDIHLKIFLGQLGKSKTEHEYWNIKKTKTSILIIVFTPTLVLSVTILYTIKE